MYSLCNLCILFNHLRWKLYAINHIRLKGSSSVAFDRCRHVWKYHRSPDTEVASGLCSPFRPP